MSEAESKVLDFLLSQLETKAKLPKQTKKERGSEEKSLKDDSMH